MALHWIRLWAVGWLLLGGCTFLPETSRRPQVHNPFPQLHRVAVAPFFNLSTEPSVDGRQFALAYYNELQCTPGFEVVPVGVVEQQMKAHGLTLNGAEQARKLAQLLQVDAVIVGAVTDFTPYYPPRCALQVEWYTANPGFHPIPAGYGLPWGTPDEEHIPPALIFEAQLALAREQLKTQEPAYRPLDAVSPEADKSLPASSQTSDEKNKTQRASAEESMPESVETIVTGVKSGAAGLPPDWPNPSGLTPAQPRPQRPALHESRSPVLSHTRTFNGHDADVTEALRTYAYYRDDARFGGWQSYLQRSDDFIRFCCHMHIAEMLSARGGAGETRVVWRWPTGR